MQFTHAIVRTPGKSVVHGLTSNPLGPPYFPLLTGQHAAYCAALETVGLEIITLPPLEAFPDSCFVEDVAVVSPDFAIITRPGAPSRRGEADYVIPAIEANFNAIHRITAPGTLEGGDVLQVGKRYFVGLSRRTNRTGAEQFKEIAEQAGYRVDLVPLREMLHLKTGVNPIDAHTLVVTGEFEANPLFDDFHLVAIPPQEAYAANCLNINGYIIMPSGFPHTYKLLQDRGYEIFALPMSEFKKLDGGLSCLSIRF